MHVPLHIQEGTQPKAPDRRSTLAVGCHQLVQRMELAEVAREKVAEDLLGAVCLQEVTDQLARRHLHNLCVTLGFHPFQWSATVWSEDWRI